MPNYGLCLSTINIDVLLDEVMLRLYRCDKVHVWLGTPGVHVDVVMPKVGLPNYPYGLHHSLSIAPGDLPMSGRTPYIRYMLEKWIVHDVELWVTDLADNLLFDLYRYGKVDTEKMARDWSDFIGMNAWPSKFKHIKASEMPKHGRVQWAADIAKNVLRLDRFM